jgi:hypothetical protein
MPLIALTYAAGHAIGRAATITRASWYTASLTSANAVNVLSQAHSENRVYRSGKPAGAIFICGAGGVS